MLESEACSVCLATVDSLLEVGDQGMAQDPNAATLRWRIVAARKVASKHSKRVTLAQPNLALALQSAQVLSPSLICTVYVLRCTGRWRQHRLIVSTVPVGDISHEVSLPHPLVSGPSGQMPNESLELLRRIKNDLSMLSNCVTRLEGTPSRPSPAARRPASSANGESAAPHPPKSRFIFYSDSDESLMDLRLRHLWGRRSCILRLCLSWVMRHILMRMYR